MTLRRAAAALVALTLASGCATRSTQATYEALQDWYLAQGLLRTDYDPIDAPFTRDDLVRDFEKIAFHSEYAPGDTLRQQDTPTELFKWSDGLSWSLDGDAAEPSDYAAMRVLTLRLGAATGLSFIELPPDAVAKPDVTMMILGPRTRQAVAKMIRERDDGPSLPLVQAWAREDKFPCIGHIGQVDRDKGGMRLRAFILIKAETTRLLRQSCLHEEFTQVLGLLNDGDDVRPSIFNDGQEFALLTRHDEMLLRILYDPRLKAGMTAQEGMPIVRRIAAELPL
ncbi:MAG: hypothetical protein ACI9ZH_000364 [Paracoccaceae bacterium]|jgi:hypothetical protein